MRISVKIGALLSAAAILAIAHQAPAHAQADTNQPQTPKTVTVQPGDSLSKIAQANGTTYPRLYDANTEIQDPDLIYPNQSIRIPDANEQLPDRPLSTDAPAAPEPAAPSSEADVSYQPRQTPSAPAAYYPSGGSVWDRLAECESGGNWSINTGNGFYGGLQFTQQSWQAAGGSGSPSQASKAEQIAVARNLQAKQGWSAWPACSAKLGIQ